MTNEAIRVLQVVKARHLESGKVVALKRVWTNAPAVGQGAGTAPSDPVKREIEAMSAIDHGNVVRLHCTIPLVRRSDMCTHPPSRHS